MKMTIASLNDVPEALRGEYEPLESGGFRVKIEGEIPGFVPAEKLAEATNKAASEKSTQIGLRKKLDEVQAQLKTFEGIDPAAVADMKAKIEKFEGAGVKQPDDVVSMLRKGVEQATTPLQKQIDDLRAESKAKDDRIRNARLDTILRTAAIDAGVADSAIEDFVARGLRTYQLDEHDRPIAKDGDDIVLSMEKPGNPMPPLEWAKGLSEKAPHLFKTSKGAGAAPPAGGAGASGAVRKIIVPDGPMMLSEADRKDVAEGRAVAVRG